MHVTMKISEHTEILHRVGNIQGSTVKLENMIQSLSEELAISCQAKAYLDRIAYEVAKECAEVELMMS